MSIWAAIPPTIQSLFWITAGTVTVLTYRHARTTVLQPLRTEVFKLQLEEMNKLLAVFTDKSRTIGNFLGHEEAFDVNVLKFYDRYLSLQFGLEPQNLAERPYNNKSAQIILKADDIVSIATPHILPTDDEEQAYADQSPKDWISYKFIGVMVPQACRDAEKELEKFLANPILPTRSVELINELISRHHRTLGLIGDVFNDHRGEMPLKYPTIEHLQRAQTAWLHRDWKDRSPDCTEIADQIINYARNFFAADEFDAARNSKATLKRRPFRSDKKLRRVRRP